MNTATFRHHCSIIGGLRPMADALGKTHSTVQRYYDGTAKVPEEYAAKIEQISNGVNTFMANLPTFLARKLAADFPQGIQSEGE